MLLSVRPLFSDWFRFQNSLRLVFPPADEPRVLVLGNLQFLGQSKQKQRNKAGIVSVGVFDIIKGEAERCDSCC